MDLRKKPNNNSGKGTHTDVSTYCVRVWFTSGKTFNKVFDDYEDARHFSNDMINRKNVDDANLWEL